MVRRQIGGHQSDKEQHKRELIDVLTKLENAAYRLSENETEFFKSEIEWVGRKIDQNGIRLLQDKLKAIQELKEQKNEKELKSFWEAIQFLSKYTENLSAQTDLLKQLLKQNKQMDMDTRTLRGIYAIEKQNHGDTVFSTLQLQSTEYDNYRRQYKRPRRNPVARTA